MFKSYRPIMMDLNSINNYFTDILIVTTVNRDFTNELSAAPLNHSHHQFSFIHVTKVMF